MNDADPAAISATYRAVKTMADGTPRVTLDLDCTLETAAKVLGLPGDVVAVARLTKKAAEEATPSFYRGESLQHEPGPLAECTAAIVQQIESSYGEEAKALKLSSFFRTPAVWKAIGTDEEFAEWIRRKKCCICGVGDWVDMLGDLRCEAAHVRRAGESGTGYKADYARVPMCHEHHIDYQHQRGESEAYNVWRRRNGHSCSSEEEREAKDWFDKKRIEYVQAWGWETLKAGLGYESWKEVPPSTLRDWTLERGLEQYLPSEYR